MPQQSKTQHGLRTVLAIFPVMRKQATLPLPPTPTPTLTPTLTLTLTLKLALTGAFGQVDVERTDRTREAVGKEVLLEVTCLGLGLG